MKKNILLVPALISWFLVYPQGWGEVNKAVTSDRGLNEEFANSVAISGNYAFIGSRSEDEDVLGKNYIQQADAVYFLRGRMMVIG